MWSLSANACSRKGKTGSSPGKDIEDGGMHIDRKRLQKLRAKKIALRHKPDDYAEEQDMSGMTMGGLQV